MSSSFTLESLLQVSEVARAGSISAAARNLGLTQPALSASLTRLEAGLGVSLFRRTPRGTEPTEALTTLLPLMRAVLGAADRLDDAVLRIGQATPRQLKIGWSPLVSHQLRARTYARLGAKGGVAPEYVKDDLAALLARLRAGELDAVFAPSVRALDGLERKVVDSEPLVLVESTEPEAHAVSLAQTFGRDLVMMEDTCGLTAFTHSLFASRGVSAKVTPVAAANYAQLEERAGKGEGAALMPVSTLGEAGTPHRPVVDESGRPVELIVEMCWDPTSDVAAQVASLAEVLSTRTY